MVHQSYFAGPVSPTVPDSVSAAVFAISVDAIVCVDESQSIILFNDGAEEIFGYSAAEVLGQPLQMLLPDYARAKHHEQVAEFGRSTLVARRMGERGEIAGRHKSGELFPAEASISHVDVEGKRVYTAVLRDTSERRRAEAERARLLDAERVARSAAEAATRARGVILGVVSHDLRNPLSTIAMCASALEQGGAESEATRLELAQTIQQAADWMNRLIQDLLDVASIEAGRLSLELNTERGADLVARAAALFEPIVRDAGLSLETQVESDLPELRIDAQRVTQVLANLVMNACKFTQRGGRVLLRASRASDGGVRFSVADTGCGITADALPHVFDSFWQNRQGSSTRGTGLGLAIARGIVEAHGGRIWVESE
ncbi:MAG: ATP-binding protein, partial [Gemmatimonadota bacterium]|nr:ATP-binding protein [Gemmatimonadota bacterium]